MVGIPHPRRAVRVHRAACGPRKTTRTRPPEALEATARVTLANELHCFMHEVPDEDVAARMREMQTEERPVNTEGAVVLDRLHGRLSPAVAGPEIREIGQLRWKMTALGDYVTLLAQASTGGTRLGPCWTGLRAALARGDRTETQAGPTQSDALPSA